MLERIGGFIAGVKGVLDPTEVREFSVYREDGSSYVRLTKHLRSGRIELFTRDGNQVETIDRVISAKIKNGRLGRFKASRMYIDGTASVGSESMDVEEVTSLLKQLNLL